MHRRTRLDPDVRKEQILEAAERLFTRRDPFGVTFEVIAEAAGVSRGLVYNYFSDKGELLARVYERVFLRLDAALDAARARARSPEDGLRCVVDAYLKFAEANAGVFTHLVASAAAHHPRVQDVRRERLDRLAKEWGGAPAAVLAAAAVTGLLEEAACRFLELDDLHRGRVIDFLVALLGRGLPGVVEPPLL